MAEIVNLKRVRKNKARAEKDQKAAANRAVHGTPKALRKLKEAKTEKAKNLLDAHKLTQTDE